MNVTRGLLLTIVICAAGRTLQAQGISMVMKETGNGSTATNRVQIDKDHMRAEARTDQGQSAFIFDAQKQVVRMVNLDQKTYMELTKAEMDQMRQQMSGAMAQLQEQLKNIPPEQRAAVEQMMRARGGALPGAAQPPAKIQFRKTGSDKVGQWACTTYDGLRGQEKVASVCAIDPKDLGVNASDFEITRQLQQFLASLVPQAADRMFVMGSPDDQGFAGVPVRHTTYRNGAVESVSELTEFRRETFPASTFDVPAGFRKEGPPGRGRD
jgi:hypothetical protein